ncbi:glycine betaine ABC transporter substrate-binding protein [Peptostreptococcaceae bacterium AGR-M142]
MKLKKIILFISIFMIFSLNACDKANENIEKKDKKETIVLGDPGWNSVRIHNNIVSYILKHGYGYETRIYEAGSEELKIGLKNKEVNILMEYWLHDFKEYNYQITNKYYETVSVNYDDNRQGIYVPKYVIEGDVNRGIKPIAKDLRRVDELINYKDKFILEGQDYPKIYGPVKGWGFQEFLYNKFDGYNISSNFEIVVSNSGEELGNYAEEAYVNGLPWVGYYWEPTVLMGKYEFIKLEEDPYSEDIFLSSGLCEMPQEDVLVLVDTEFRKKHKDLYEFLSNYETTNEINNELLAYDDIHENKDDVVEYFLEEYEFLWLNWVSEDAYKKIKLNLE